MSKYTVGKTLEGFYVLKDGVIMNGLPGFAFEAQALAAAREMPDTEPRVFTFEGKLEFNQLVYLCEAILRLTGRTRIDPTDVARLNHPVRVTITVVDTE